MCISTIDIQIDLFCQQLAATSQQTSLVEETTPAALAISDTNVQAQQVWVVVQFRTRNGLNSERGQMAQIGTR